MAREATETYWLVIGKAAPLSSVIPRNTPCYVQMCFGQIGTVTKTMTKPQLMIPVCWLFSLYHRIYFDNFCPNKLVKVIREEIIQCEYLLPGEV